MIISAKTDIGKKRQTNQDSFFVDKDGKWCILADGMGGHNGGETASEATVKIVAKYMEQPIKSVKSSLINSLTSANREIYEISMKNSSLSGMGSTAVLAYFDDDTATIAHVGDSRAYRIANGNMVQITKDHSIVQQLIDCGTISHEDASTHPQKNLITRAIGTEPTIHIDINSVDYQEGDYFLICSDGLTNAVEDELILKTIIENEVDDATSKLIQIANENDGADNITVILIKQ